MGKFLERTLDKITERGIDRVLYLLGILVAPLVAKATAKLAAIKFPELSQGWLWFISGSVFSGIIALVAVYYRRNNKFVPYFPKIDPPIIALERNIFYKINSRENITEVLDSKIKILKNGVESIKGMCRWDGDGCTIESKVAGQTTRMIESKDHYKEFETRFDTLLAKNKETHTITEKTLTDTKRVSRPYFQEQISRPCKKLIIKIMFPPEFKITSIRGQVLFFSPYYPPVDEINIRVDSSGIGEWIIPKPKLFYSYRISWEWPT